MNSFQFLSFSFIRLVLRSFALSFFAAAVASTTTTTPATTPTTFPKTATTIRRNSTDSLLLLPSFFLSLSRAQTQTQTHTAPNNNNDGATVCPFRHNSHPINYLFLHALYEGRGKKRKLRRLALNYRDHYYCYRHGPLPLAAEWLHCLFSSPRPPRMPYRCVLHCAVLLVPSSLHASRTSYLPVVACLLGSNRGN